MSRTHIVMLLVRLSVGCTPRSYVVFINATDKNVTIKLMGGESDYLVETLPIGPRMRSGRTEMFGSTAEVSIEGSPTPYKQGFPRLDPKRRYWKPSERLAYLLVTESAICAIPLEFRENWIEHIDDITETAREVQPAHGGDKVNAQ